MFVIHVFAANEQLVSMHFVDPQILASNLTI
jgi:hypothetical protein